MVASFCGTSFIVDQILATQGTCRGSVDLISLWPDWEKSILWPIDRRPNYSEKLVIRNFLRFLDTLGSPHYSCTVRNEIFEIHRTSVPWH